MSLATAVLPSAALAHCEQRPPVPWVQRKQLVHAIFERLGQPEQADGAR